MSDGLKLLSSICDTGSSELLLSLNRELFVQDEIPVFDFVIDHFRRYREVPHAATVLSETSQRLPRAPEPASFYFDAICQRKNYLIIRQHWSEMQEALAQKNPNRVIELMQRSVREARATTPHESYGVTEVMEQTSDRLDNTRGQGAITGIESGWAGVDRLTGGYQNGDLVTYVARPAIGKTYVLLKQAHFAHSQGKSVLFVTTEMSAEQIGRRFISIAMGLNPTSLKLNQVSTHMMNRIREFTRDMPGGDRFQIFSVGMNSRINAIESMCQEFSPDIVFVDGAYLLKPTEVGRTASRTERITGVFDELKAMTLTVDRPFIVTTQFSRQAGKGGKEGSLENIGYTDAVGTHSSIIAAIKHGPTENPSESRTIEFLKGREGEYGEIAINFKFAPLDMSEITSPNAPSDGSNYDMTWTG